MITNTKYKVYINPHIPPPPTINFLKKYKSINEFSSMFIRQKEVIFGASYNFTVFEKSV